MFIKKSAVFAPMGNWLRMEKEITDSDMNVIVVARKLKTTKEKLKN
jgi:hypothetical protein